MFSLKKTGQKRIGLKSQYCLWRKFYHNRSPTHTQHWLCVSIQHMKGRTEGGHQALIEYYLQTHINVYGKNYRREISNRLDALTLEKNEQGTYGMSWQGVTVFQLQKTENKKIRNNWRKLNFRFQFTKSVAISVNVSLNIITSSMRWKLVWQCCILLQPASWHCCRQLRTFF